MLVVASLLGIFVARLTGKSTIARIFAVSIYTVVLLVIIAALIFTASVVILLSKGQSPLGMRDSLEKAWYNTVDVKKEDACRLQADFECFGFSDNFCLGCGTFNSSDIRDCSEEQAPQCPICEDTLPSTSAGCYGTIINATKGFYIPVGISSAAVAGVLLFDAVLVCAL